MRLRTDGQRKKALHALAQARAAANHGQLLEMTSLLVPVYASINDTDRVLAALETSYAQRSSIMMTLKVDHYFDPMRSDPRFQDLMRRVGFSQ